MASEGWSRQIHGVDESGGSKSKHAELQSCDVDVDAHRGLSPHGADKTRGLKPKQHTRRSQSDSYAARNKRKREVATENALKTDNGFVDLPRKKFRTLHGHSSIVNGNQRSCCQDGLVNAGKGPVVGELGEGKVAAYGSRRVQEGEAAGQAQGCAA